MTQKPKGYWNKANCMQEAAKYASKKEWRDKSASSYVVARKNSWIEECSLHMSPLRKQGGYTKKEVISDAKKYQTRTEWRNSSGKRGPSPIYSVAQRMGWLDEACAHMIEIQKPNGYWTKTRISEEAKKFQSIKEWKYSSNVSYQLAVRNKWVTELTSHMPKLNISYGEYLIHKFLISHDIEYQEEKTFDGLISKSALFYDFYLPKFNLIIEFHGEQHYQFNKWWHKSQQGFEESQSRDEIKRNYLLKKSIHFLEISYKDILRLEEIITNKILEISKSSNVAATLIKRDLTKKELDQISSMCRWTKDSVLIDALKYQTLSEWKKSSPSANTIARKNGWFAEASAHLSRKIIPRNTWTREMVIEEAKKYQSRSEWSKNHSRTYKVALTNNWDIEACKHMPGISRNRLKRNITNK